MAKLTYHCLCGEHMTFNAIDYYEHKCPKCGKILIISYDQKRDKFDIRLKED